MNRVRQSAIGSVRRRFPTALALGLALFALGCGRFNARMELKQGNAAYKEGKFEKALAFYKDVPPGYPERVDAALNSGYTCMAQYRFGSTHEKDKQLAQEAVTAYDEYIRIRPPRMDEKKYPPIEKIEEYIVTLLADSGRLEDAVTRLMGQLERKPDDPAILRAIAQTYDKWDKPTVSLEYYQKWSKLFPSNPDPGAHIAAYCWNMSYRRASTLEPIERNRWVDFGLEAADLAMKIKPDHVEAITYKNLLLRERAKLRIDPDQVALLVKDATVLLERAKELRKKAKEAEEAAKASASPSPKSGGPS